MVDLGAVLGKSWVVFGGRDARGAREDGPLRVDDPHHVLSHSGAQKA